MRHRGVDGDHQIIGGGLLLNPGTSWHAIGTSDFNGDGKADILWQNTDGMPQIWEMNGTNIIGSGTLINPGSAWQLKDDGPISPDPTQTGLQPPALHLSTPDGSAPQSAPPSATIGFINLDYASRPGRSCTPAPAEFQNATGKDNRMRVPLSASRYSTRADRPKEPTSGAFGPTLWR
jgi:hypothetical protein